MKTLLTTTMLLGAVVMLEASQPVKAAVTAPVASDKDQSQTTQVWWGRYGYWHPNYYGGWRGGWGGPFFRVW